MRPHNPDLCDYVVLDTVVAIPAELRSTLLAAPDDVVPDSNDDFESADTMVSMRTSMGYVASGRAPALLRKRVLDLCPKCEAPLVTAKTPPEVLAMLPVRCDGGCA